MEDYHLSLETLARWIAGTLEHDEVLQLVVPHFLEKCPVCRERRDEIRRLQKEVGHWSEEVVVLEGLLAPELWERLEDRSYPEQVREVEGDEDLHIWGLCQLILAKSREAVFSNPARAVDLANLALQVVRHLDDAYDPSWILDLRARCFAYLGNARRVLGELRSADDAFAKADSCLARGGTGNRETEAEILDLKSSLRRAQRRFPEALALADRALVLYQESGDSRGVWKTSIKKSKILEEAGDFSGAIDLLQLVSQEIDPDREPRFVLYSKFNLLSCLIAAERFDEAEKLLPEIRALSGSQPQPVDLLRLHWMEGLIDLNAGRLGPAEAAFRDVQREFLSRGMGYDAALVSLDLARLYAQEGCTDDLKKLASELMPIFESRDVHREAIVALLMFQRACAEERTTVEMIREIAAFLRRERRGNGMS
ncbi:MAG TPA: hypothetical protein VF789_27275 [Thermoanaerobaculia bacterium]